MGAVLIIGCLAVPVVTAQVEWRALAATGEQPGPRRGAAGLFEPESGQLVFQGGETATVRFLDDLWRFDPVTLRWERVDTSGLPLRCHHTLVLDDSRQRGLMFGGFPRTNQLLEWDLLDGQWHDVTPAISPPARCLHSSVIDRARERMIVYGGLNGNFLPDLSDTWALDLVSGQWTRLVASGGPGERYGHVAAIDADRDRMIVFGGLLRDPISGIATETNDLWAFDLAANRWAPLQAGGSAPAPRQFAAGAVIPGGGSLILFGGRSGNEFFDETWELDFQSLRWRRLATVGPNPPARFRHTLIADALGERLWMAFGEGEQGLHFNDVWELDIRALLGDESLSPAALSGLWFDPELEGEGFNILVAETGLLVYFYGYAANGERLWLVSDVVPGPIAPNQPVQMSLYEAIGGTFESPAPSAESLQLWGTLRIQFDDCDSGLAQLEGADGSKDSHIEKLVSIDGTGCSVE